MLCLRSSLGATRRRCERPSKTIKRQGPGMPDTAVQRKLLADLTGEQQKAVRSTKRRVLVVAGAGSGKTEVMARRVAWWVAIEAIPKEQIVALPFTQRAAEEMKFRIRTLV